MMNPSELKNGGIYWSIAWGSSEATERFGPRTPHRIKATTSDGRWLAEEIEEPLNERPYPLVSPEITVFATETEAMMEFSRMMAMRCARLAGEIVCCLGKLADAIGKKASEP